MTGLRYVALIARTPQARSHWEQRTGHVLGAAPGFQKFLSGAQLALVTNAEPVTVDPQGIVIGALYARGRRTAVSSLDKEAMSATASTWGDWLVNSHWGDYICFIAPRDHDALAAVRAPFGELSCFFQETLEGVLLASDIALLRDYAGYESEVDWAALTRHIAAENLTTPATCLSHVTELLGGQRMTVREGRATSSEAWPIWAFTAPDKRLVDAHEAATRVRDAVTLAVAARAERHDRLVLRLSGGLDSSIVAAALVKAGKTVTALTMVTDDRAGDERDHAARVATHLNIPLIAVARRTAAVDLTRSAARHLPRPAVRAFTQASLDAARAIAEKVGATAIYDGGGGDNMFAFLQSVAPVADCLHADGGTGHFWRTARSLGRAGQTATWRVAIMALRRHWTRGPAFRWPLDLSLLSHEAQAWAKERAPHPWLDPPAGTLPGSAAHVALILSAQAVVQARDPFASLDAESPLISQPVAEACLRVPSWLWTRDGHDRVIARDAFRNALPRRTIERRDKGAPDSFLIQLVEDNAGLIREMLASGRLAQAGLLDVPAILAALEPRQLMTGANYMRLMQLVDAETWARSWQC